MGFSPLDSGFGGGSDIMFTVVPVIIFLGFIFVFGFIIFQAIKGGIEWNKNNNSPILTINAKIVAKRMTVSTHHHHGGNHSMHHHSSFTSYFATFQAESGDRIEFKIPAKEYGMLAEGDNGKLNFQGTRYKGFERT